jgi:hypothetical protein
MVAQVGHTPKMVGIGWYICTALHFRNYPSCLCYPLVPCRVLRYPPAVWLPRCAGNTRLPCPSVCSADA